MQISNNFFSNSNLTSLVFNELSTEELLSKQSVSKAWLSAVDKNEVCSIVKTTVQVAKQLLSGEISEPKKLLNQMQCGIYKSSYGSQGVYDQKGLASFYIKKDPTFMKAFVPFSSFEHTTFAEKSSFVLGFLNIGLTDIKNALAKKESTREHYDAWEATGYDVLENNNLTSVKLYYEPKDGNNLTTSIELTPVKKEGKIPMADHTTKGVVDYFKNHKINL